MGVRSASPQRTGCTWLEKAYSMKEMLCFLCEFVWLCNAKAISSILSALTLFKEKKKTVTIFKCYPQHVDKLNSCYVLLLSVTRKTPLGETETTLKDQASSKLTLGEPWIEGKNG